MISFLLGSGFSFEEGIPGVKEINDRLVNLQAKHIRISSDLSASFLEKDQEDPNGRFSLKDRMFVEEFIQFYIHEVIKDKSKFNYEDFFDYYFFPYRDNNFPKELKNFLDNYRNKIQATHRHIDDNINLIGRFHNTFSQLIASLLNQSKYYQDVSLLNYPKYDPFIRFLKYCISDHDIKVHSLNHDMFFEFLGSHHEEIAGYYCDGFTDLGSPYYGDVSFTDQGIIKTHKVRIKFFNGKYNNKLCFSKLHGSVDTYIFNLASPTPDLTRVKRNWRVGDLYKEETNKETGELQYVSGYQYNYPDFLSGTTAKILYYDNEFYKPLFDHFCHNLQSSDYLFVIGYGFKDEKINEMIEKNYLSKGKRMIVVDPYPKEDAFQKEYDITYIRKRITELTYKEWTSLCELKATVS
ncbi:hypothetical protein HB364_05285 [Pseudoflavitalea sp. X16]|uniref:SIR2 family protein n=1 Tax=Paraflavitalea devenefica TaxID=2716334 RepID=UPI00141FC6A4|nr:SIR2 family protein [Paraflavitalea devenefica]NII24479.1 hypothetical protein [Paraflavitalea devenefica]